MNEGDKIIIYTDVVTEAKNEFFTQERLIDILEHALPFSSRDFISYINEKIHRPTETTPQADDITIVVMERRPEE